MRCPYCAMLNSERAKYCVRCGRDMTSSVTSTPKQFDPRQHPTQQPTNQPPSRTTPPTQGYPQTPTQQRQTPQGSTASAPPMPQQQPLPIPRTRQAPVPIAPPAPEAPAPFPPRTMAQLQALEVGALPYTLVDTTNTGRKKVVRITYAQCAAWQQMATLQKALKEQQETRFESIIIQGFLPQNQVSFTFTNGQLVFDRNVRLGGQTIDRYQVETGNGFEIDSVRVVLSE